MTSILVSIAFLCGYGLARVLRVDPTVVTLVRPTDDWVEINGVRERLCWDARYVRGLLDRLAAAQRERSVLIDLLREYRVDECGSVELELKVVK
jgi:hypothetical protein